MDEKNETTVEEEATEELSEEPTAPETDWEAEAKKARGIAQRALTKLKKLGDKPKEVEKPAEPVKKEAKTGELDETQLDYLDLKGISDPDQIAVIQKVISKTGVTVREALKDDYVQSKLKDLAAAKELADATPGSAKRSGAGTGDSLAAAIAKYEQSGYQELPDDFETRSKVINAIVAKSSTNKPAWHK